MIKIKGLRWWMISLIMLGSVINYLTRSTLAVAAPTVLKELHVFAEGRTQYDSALADQKFLMDSDSYMRFVCHAMIRRLMDVERDRVSDR